MSGERDDAPAEPKHDFADEDQETLAAIAERERTAGDGGYPGDDAVQAMEQPVGRLMGAASLLDDLMILSARTRFLEEELRPIGLMFLTGAMLREAERLYRLYFGKPPDYG